MGQIEDQPGFVSLALEEELDEFVEEDVFDFDGFDLDMLDVIYDVGDEEDSEDYTED